MNWLAKMLFGEESEKEAEEIIEYCVFPCGGGAFSL